MRLRRRTSVTRGKSVCRRAERKRANGGGRGGDRRRAVPLAPPHDPLGRRSGFRSLFKDKATGGGGGRCAGRTAGPVKRWRRRRWPRLAGRGLARVGV